MSQWVSLEERVERLEATIAALVPLFDSLGARSRSTAEGMMEIAAKLDELIALEKRRAPQPDAEPPE